MKGYVHVYTGNGKGKTTAAFGLALRAAGAGRRVFIAQFVKGREYSEIKAVEQYLPLVTVKQYGRECFIVNAPAPEDRQAAQAGLEELEKIIPSGEYNVIVLDEACIALHYHLFTVQELIRLISLRAEGTEIVVTGRYAPPELIHAADLVTDMKEVKHYYRKGVEARKGIEY
ncbi:MAG TPA: cob(I)yrinic acid a,c-diamide adenosyltransferase [Bacteroidetes bacterium]|nr:cob(I)yrinic acid a,c-diamide adenosyltransferase [Bacteroidota bacterium]